MLNLVFIRIELVMDGIGNSFVGVNVGEELGGIFFDLFDVEFFVGVGVIVDDISFEGVF